MALEIELVVFDIAGTVIKDDNYVRTMLKDVVSAYTSEVRSEDLDHVMGWPKPKALRYLLERGSKDITSYDDIFLDKLHAEFVEKMISFFRDSNNLEEIGGATEVFKELKSKGIKIALDTGFSRPIADIIIKKLGWSDGILDATVASDEVANGRPKPDMIYHLMNKLNIKDASYVAKVGDTESDIKQGRHAGCGMVIGVTSGSCTEDELLSFKADYVIDSVRVLPEFWP